MALAEEVAELSIPGRLVPPENWHLTVRFLGSVDRVTYERFLSGLCDVQGVPAFKIGLDRYGAFPRAPKATVVWAGLSEGIVELSRLNEIAEEAAIGAGLSPEDRPYSPHLTLSRVRPPQDVRWLEDEELQLEWQCDRLVVFRSHQGRGGVRYEPLETLMFTG